MKCEYKEFCDGEGKATHQCEDCKMKYCEECADSVDNQCECIAYENIKLIKKEVKNDKQNTTNVKQISRRIKK